MDQDTKNILMQARDEITMLRRDNDLMNAKLEGIEMMHQAVISNAPPPGPQGMSECVVHKINQHLDKATR